jgi:hypothetical protein
VDEAVAGADDRPSRTDHRLLAASLGVTIAQRRPDLFRPDRRAVYRFTA